jgi:hypothetical protein
MNIQSCGIGGGGKLEHNAFSRACKNPRRSSIAVTRMPHAAQTKLHDVSVLKNVLC